MDCYFVGFFAKMLIIFQILGEFEILNRDQSQSRRTSSISRLPVCLGKTKPQQKKNSFLWNIDKPVIGRRDTGKPAINTTEDDAFQRRPKRRPQSSRSYFFGTIHVPYSQVWDYVSPSTKQAFEDADHVIFELDLTNRRTVQALTACQVLPEKQNLSDVLPKELFARLKGHLDYVRRTLPTWTTAEHKGLGIYADYLFNALTSNWERKRPIWVLLMLNSLSEPEVKSRGIPVLDLYLAQEASRQQKQTGAVERVDEQCQPLNEMELGQVIVAIDQSLSHRERLRNGSGVADTEITSTDDLVYHYNCGDLNSVIFKKDSAQAAVGWVAGPGAAETNKVDEYFRIELIQKRNRRMAKRVVELLEAHPKRKFFFAFGAGHFLGNHSVIDYMAELGYNVTHVPANYQIKRFGRRRNRQKSSTYQADATLDLSSLNRWETGQHHFFPDTDRILANIRSDYVDDRAYERDQRRRLSRINAGHEAGRHFTTPRPANRNFNELWIRRNGDTTPKSRESMLKAVTESTNHRQPTNRENHAVSLAASQTSTKAPLFLFCVPFFHLLNSIYR